MTTIASPSQTLIRDEVARALHKRIDELREDVRGVGKAQTQLSERFGSVETKVVGYIETAKEIQSDHEERLRLLEQYRWKLMGMLLAGSVMAGLVMKVIERAIP